MMKHRRLAALAVIAIALCIVLSGCNTERPTISRITFSLSGNREHYETLVMYLKELPFDYVFIDSDDGTVFYDFADHEIESDNVRASIHCLWKNGCEFICKDAKNGNNTIWFQLWHQTSGGLDCGLACTIDGTGDPNVVFQTEFKEIAAGWYYYYSDYEAYRIERHN